MLALTEEFGIVVDDHVVYDEVLDVKTDLGELADQAPSLVDTQRLRNGHEDEFSVGWIAKELGDLLGQLAPALDQFDKRDLAKL